MADSAQNVTLRMPETIFQQDITLDRLRHDMAVFVAEREWEKFHTPRNILLALAGEVGEIAECFQWRGDDGAAHLLPTWNEKDKTHLGEELSDVLLYLLRLSDICGVDLPAAAIRKMGLNRSKYPADKARGRSDKYTAYIEDKAAAASSSQESGAKPAAAGAGGEIRGDQSQSVSGLVVGATSNGGVTAQRVESDSTPFTTPRKGTPAEARTPKESPTNPIRFTLVGSDVSSTLGAAQGSAAESASGSGAAASSSAAGSWREGVRLAADFSIIFVTIAAVAFGVVKVISRRR